jgi:hypothetical protein
VGRNLVGMVLNEAKLATCAKGAPQKALAFASETQTPPPTWASVVKFTAAGQFAPPSRPVR